MSRFLAKLLNITGLYSASEPPPRVVAGTACNCGPGFCADAKGIGYIGSCSEGDGERIAAPDCTRCGAPHQSTRGCWLCQTRSADMTKPQDSEDRVNTDFWLRCLVITPDGQEIAIDSDGFLATPALLGVCETLRGATQPDVLTSLTLIGDALLPAESAYVVDDRLAGAVCFRVDEMGTETAFSTEREAIAAIRAVKDALRSDTAAPATS